MLMSLSRKFAALLLNDSSDPDKIEACAYGIDLALYTMLSTLSLILIGCVFGKMIDTVILIMTYYLNQTIGGGYHASTHWRCFVSMVISLLICLALIQFFQSVAFLPSALALISVAVLWRHPLHLHPNKAYLKDKAATMKEKSRICSLGSLIAVLVLVLAGTTCAFSAALGLFAAALSRLIGIKYQEGRIS